MIPGRSFFGFLDFRASFPEVRLVLFKGFGLDIGFGFLDIGVRVSINQQYKHRD